MVMNDNNVIATANIVIAVMSIFTGVAAIATAVISRRIGNKQIESSKQVSSLEMFLKLDDRYEGNLIQIRKRVSNQLRQTESSMIVSPSDEIETLLDYFETLGHLTRRGLIEKDLVLNEYSIPVRCYWKKLTNYIMVAQRRYEDKTVYEATKWLYECACEEEVKDGRNPNVSDETMDYFFNIESGRTGSS